MTQLDIQAKLRALEIGVLDEVTHAGTDIGKTMAEALSKSMATA